MSIRVQDARAMFAIRDFRIPFLLTALLAMAGCDGLTTGEKVQSIPVKENDTGGYGPVTLSLSPDMAPVAINFRAEHGDNPAEIGKWNAYRATLGKDGQEIASGQFNINHTGTLDTLQGSPYLLRNMLTAWPREAGNYELSITPTQPVEVKLSNARVEVRRNVRGDDNLR